ncbi:MAG: phosphoglycerate kinase [Pseudomonadota bacterium]
MFSLPTLDSFPVKDHRVLMRVDLNVPLDNGKILDTTRIDRVIPEITYLLQNQAKVILMAHLGRPKGQPAAAFSLKVLLDMLAQKLGQPIFFSSDCVGTEAKQAVSKLQPGEVLLLENLRFHAGEENNDLEFAQRLAELGDLYVNNAFSVSHRAHASVEAITHLLPVYAGKALAVEIHALISALEHPKGPLMGIVGGSKVSTKISVLHRLVEKLDILVLGGGIAHTFLLANGVEIGKSICEPAQMDVAKDIMLSAKKQKTEIYLPEDAVVVEDFTTFSGHNVRDMDEVRSGEIILDIGPKTVEKITQLVSQNATLVWNGPLGLLERPPYDRGSISVAKAIARQTASGELFSVAGGGETVTAINRAQCADKFSYVSTAGGAFLEFLEGKRLPGLEIVYCGERERSNHSFSDY